ncbi:DUF3299 domain-containing protein [Stenotrophomonas sp. S39]|uniref:DUF3299 domain-containing protein n=1 Tax=Stenotrophomonas sp. S39 TaxID=2767451 RepID=UPI00190B3C36|nr:DUF3299 domain-containing protein [Stenotrophomonas sp. S39]MBK0052693.1 DUF3299 domain-containing protein [Stenotrophomonas sp. S39]
MLALLLVSSSSGASERVRTLAWSDLQPAGEAEHNAKVSATLTAGLYEAIRHRRVREYEAQAAALRKTLKSGTDATLDGQRVRLPGYVVPLDFDDSGNVKELLLVPFYGACLHVPAPPSNQVVHVLLQRPREIGALEVPVWIEGTMAVKLSASSMAMSSYQLTATSIKRYSGTVVPYEGPRPHSDGR